MTLTLERRTDEEQITLSPRSSLPYERDDVEAMSYLIENERLSNENERQIYLATLPFTD